MARNMMISTIAGLGVGSVFGYSVAATLAATLTGAIGCAVVVVVVVYIATV